MNFNKTYSETTCDCKSLRLNTSANKQDTNFSNRPPSSSKASSSTIRKKTSRYYPNNQHFILIPQIILNQYNYTTKYQRLLSNAINIRIRFIWLGNSSKRKTTGKLLAMKAYTDEKGKIVQILYGRQFKEGNKNLTQIKASKHNQIRQLFQRQDQCILDTRVCRRWFFIQINKVIASSL